MLPAGIVIAVLTELTWKLAPLHSVVVKRKQLPMGLLKDAAKLAKAGRNNNGLLVSEPFKQTVGGRE